MSDQHHRLQTQLDQNCVGIPFPIIDTKEKETNTHFLLNKQNKTKLSIEVFRQLFIPVRCVCFSQGHTVTLKTC